MIDLSVTPGPKAQVLIVDDHPAVREGLAFRLENLPDIELCGEASNVEEGLELFRKLVPDLAIVDLCLKVGSGFDFINRVKESYPNSRLLVWSMYSDTLYAERALRAGADGYLNKEQATDDIIDAIRQILLGRIYLSQSTADKLLRRTVATSRNLHGGQPVETLSNRELETFQLIGKGLTTGEVAHEMSANQKTIETYLARIKRKFNFESRQQLVHAAAQWVMENH